MYPTNYQVLETQRGKEVVEGEEGTVRDGNGANSPVATQHKHTITNNKHDIIITHFLLWSRAHLYTHIICNTERFVFYIDITYYIRYVQVYIHAHIFVYNLHRLIVHNLHPHTYTHNVRARFVTCFVVVIWPYISLRCFARAYIHTPIYTYNTTIHYIILYNRQYVNQYTDTSERVIRNADGIE